MVSCNFELDTIRSTHHITARVAYLACIFIYQTLFAEITIGIRTNIILMETMKILFIATR